MGRSGSCKKIPFEDGPQGVAKLKLIPGKVRASGGILRRHFIMNFLHTSKRSIRTSIDNGTASKRKTSELTKRISYSIGTAPGRIISGDLSETPQLELEVSMQPL